jgi:hypothetical protein
MSIDLREADSGWPLQRNAAHAHPCAPATFVLPCTSHAFRGIRTVHVQQRLAVSQSARRAVQPPASSSRSPAFSRPFLSAVLFALCATSVHAAEFDLQTATVADIQAAMDAGALTSEKLVQL